MKRSALLSVIMIASLIFLLGCNLMSMVGGRTVRGNGQLGESTFPVSDFAGVDMAGIGEVIIEVGEEESLRVEAEENLLPYLSAEVVSGKLVLGQQPNVTLIPTIPVRFYLTVVELDSIGVSGGGSIRGPDFQTADFSINISGGGDLDLEDVNAVSVDINISGGGNIEMNNVYADTLAITISGAGRMEIIGGEVTSQNVKISGAGTYYGRGLESQRAEVDIPGMGSATISVSESLKTTISGAGALKYVGNPSVEENITGAGRLEHISN